MKSPGESSSTGTGGGGLGFHTNLLERQGSIQGRERMIAHSTALESITAEVDSMSIGNTPCNTTGNAGNVISQVQIIPGKELFCVGISRLNCTPRCICLCRYYFWLETMIIIKIVSYPFYPLFWIYEFSFFFNFFSSPLKSGTNYGVELPGYEVSFRNCMPWFLTNSFYGLKLIDFSTKKYTVFCLLKTEFKAKKQFARNQDIQLSSWLHSRGLL